MFTECIRSLAHYGRLAIVGYMNLSFTVEIGLNHFDYPTTANGSEKDRNP
jgi:hypothetical protein